MNSVRSTTFLIVSIAASLAGGLWIYAEWARSIADIDELSQRTIQYGMRQKPPRRTVKAVYLTAYSAGSQKKLDEIIALINRTELNAVVIDIKDYTGYVLYDSNMPLVNESGLEKNLLGDVRGIIRRLHEQNIFVIARQTVFQDPVLAQKKPELAIKTKDGRIWLDYKGLSWVDPTRREIWEYNVAIAKEAIRFGFDEINFDYVRFPSDGNLSIVAYAADGREYYEVMRDFYEFLGKSFAKEPAWLSIDLFGLTMERGGEDDLNIGQRIEDAVSRVDYIAPMMYPSHYPTRHLGLVNPADHPREVIANGMAKGLPKFIGGSARVRPWLQAFSIGAVYDAAKIRAQIDAVEAVSPDGWMLWNAANRYSDAGLRPE